MSGSNKRRQKKTPPGSRSHGGNKSRVPTSVEQWAGDAYQALEKALIAFEQEYPNPDEDESLELIGYAAELAAEARGITDPNRIDEADEYAVDNVLADLETNEQEQLKEGEELQYSILFLLCYLDAHVAYGLLKEDRLEEIISHLVENYELTAD